MQTLREISCKHCGEVSEVTNIRQEFCDINCRKRFRRQLISNIKLEKGCARCGYNAHSAALDFNHIDPTTKSFHVAADATRAWHKIEAEIAKCEVLCANCHRIHSYDTHPTKVGSDGARGCQTTD